MEMQNLFSIPEVLPLVSSCRETFGLVLYPQKSVDGKARLNEIVTEHFLRSPRNSDDWMLQCLLSARNYDDDDP